MTNDLHQVTRIVLLWVNNHFNDFEGDQAMTHFLEEFEKHLEVTVSAQLRSSSSFTPLLPLSPPHSSLHLLSA